MAFTFFFRDIQILDLAVKHVVPYAMGRSRIKVWDAGCAMGPEPYSLAMILAESMGHFSFKNLTLYATDIDEQDTFGIIIKNGIYPEDELKRIPEEIFKKYFTPNGKPGHFQIVNTIRDRIVFQKHNLLSLQSIGNDFSLIMCKNVLLHFQQQERVEVMRMFHQSLAPGGYFASEQTQKMPKEIEHLFKQVASDGQIYKKEG
ncbi:MAG: chemotaxis protein CheR [Proteobacteria bacterium]|nr:chemotaxis protein CheR [Pseudomonadota bacterium]